MPQNSAPMFRQFKSGPQQNIHRTLASTRTKACSVFFIFARSRNQKTATLHHGKRIKWLWKEKEARGKKPYKKHLKLTHSTWKMVGCGTDYFPFGKAYLLGASFFPVSWGGHLVETGWVFKPAIVFDTTFLIWIVQSWTVQKTLCWRNLR